MQTIQELALSAAEEMRVAGYSPSTYWGYYVDALLPVVRFHEERGAENFDPDIMAEYIRGIEERKAKGLIRRGHRAHLLTGADKLTRMNNTGKLLWSPPGRMSKFKLNEYYAQTLEEYLATHEFHPNTRGDIIWVTKSFFDWLGREGHENLEHVAAEEIQRYIVHCSGFMTSVSMYNVLLYMRKLCTYLHERRLIDNPYTALLSMRVSRESKMYPAAPHEEITAVLEQIDRSTVMGKRDYAVILLGAVTGLRAVDIRKLKLSNIDWPRGEIKIVQSKTGKTNVLPLTGDVGEAVKDYILHARPCSADDNVFIRLVPPYIAVGDAWSIGDIYDRYRKRAGLPREAFDGKGFHSLRRALGKNMVTAGTPVTTVAQVLGDADMNSAKKYIALDSEHLAECALNFTGITPKGGEPHE